MSVEFLKSETRTARKQHRCDYCLGYINRGEKYEIDTLCFEGKLYTWKAHLECNAVASWLTDYIDPDNGITSDDFLEACGEVCRTFACPDCEHFDAEGASDGDYCKENHSFCVQKLYDLSQKYCLSAQRDSQHGWLKWRLVPLENVGNKT